MKNYLNAYVLSKQETQIQREMETAVCVNFKIIYLDLPLTPRPKTSAEGVI